MMFSNCKAFLKLLLVFVWLGIWYPPVWIALKLQKYAARDRMAMIFNCGLLKIIGIKLKVTGAPAPDRPLLLVSNHISYLDIPVIASVNNVCFTPKSEIADWPVIGGIAQLSGAVFIDRRKEKVVEVQQALKEALLSKRILCLFPEATTGNGLHMQPFKSALFSIAEEEALTAQPACILYTHVGGLPMDSGQWPNVAWYGDMVLAPHAWQLFKLGPIKAELHFLPPVKPGEYKDRKKLSAHCHKAILEQIEAIRNANQTAPTCKKPGFNPRFLRVRK